MFSLHWTENDTMNAALFLDRNQMIKEMVRLGEPCPLHKDELEATIIS